MSGRQYRDAGQQKVAVVSIKLEVIPKVSIETSANPYGTLAEIKTFDLSIDPDTVNPFFF